MAYIYNKGDECENTKRTHCSHVTGILNRSIQWCGKQTVNLKQACTCTLDWIGHRPSG